MNNLRKFNWITQYNSAKESEELVKPSVSLVIDKAVVIYDDDKPTPPKFMATYDDGRTYKLECDENTTLTTGDTRPSEYDYTKMTSAAIGDCVTSIGNSAFDDCIRLKNITIPYSITSIGNRAFRNCSGLTSVTIPSGVTSISDGAFEYCSGLTSVTIPSGVTSIGEMAFLNCRNLQGITIEATTPPRLGGIYAFATNYPYFSRGCPIYVPSASVNAYKTATYWSEYASRIQPIP